MLLRIVHPGGHVELHDRPVTAAQIMCLNPRCCVAYPYVFQQPWAIVEPDTMLMLGQKYYVVPISTVRKLQNLSPRHSPSPSPSREITISPSAYETRNTQSSREEKDDGMMPTCCMFRKKSIAKQCNNYKQHSQNERKKSEIRSNLSRDANDKNGSLSHDSWFGGLFNAVVTKANVSDMTKETRASPSRTGVCDSNTPPTRKRNRDLTGKRGPPKKAWSSDYWQPSLDSITEE